MKQIKVISLRMVKPKGWSDQTDITVTKDHAYIVGKVESVGNIYLVVTPIMVDFVHANEYNDAINAVTIRIPNVGVGVSQNTLLKCACTLYRRFPFVKKGYSFELGKPGLYVKGWVDYIEQTVHERIITVVPDIMHFSRNIMGKKL